MDKKEVIEFFDARAEAWDRSVVHDDEVISEILDNANVGPGCDVLDVACGTGILFPYYLSRGVRSVIGIDISEEMMKIGREKVEAAGLGDAIKFQNEDCAHMSFADKSFDAVVSAFALRNFEDLQQCLNEMYRVLEPGGTIAVIDLCNPKHFPMKQLFAIYQKFIMPLVSRRFIGDKEAASYLNDTMKVVPSGKDMARLFEQAGFQNVNYRALQFGMCYLYTGIKGVNS